MTREHVSGPSAVHHQWATGQEPLPGHVPAMFSCGDPHAAQGDGEISVTALKAPLSGGMRSIAEVVDAGVWNVAMTVPQAVFDGDY